jgi:predicted lipoprotein with Yx(FWY)xxD motif
MLKPKHSSVIAVTLAAALGTVGFFAATLPAKSAVGSAATVSLRSTRLGRILVNSQGHTLYLFAKDPAGKSACSAGCATVWRPLVDVTKPSAGTGIKAALLGRAKRGDGRMQVTYHGHPLYTYARDTAAGQTKGEAVSAFGARRYAVSAAGTAVHGTSTTTTTATTTTTSTTTTTTTTTSPPPARAVAGRYCGFTGNGSGICFDVTAGGQSWANGHFGVLNATCQPGSTGFDITFDTTGSTPIAADLSFNFTAVAGSAAGTAVTGTFDTGGHASGHLHVADTFTYSDGTQYSCGLDTDWTAQLQS